MTTITQRAADLAAVAAVGRQVLAIELEAVLCARAGRTEYCRALTDHYGRDIPEPVPLHDAEFAAVAERGLAALPAARFAVVARDPVAVADLCDRLADYLPPGWDGPGDELLRGLPDYWVEVGATAHPPKPFTRPAVEPSTLQQPLQPVRAADNLLVSLRGSPSTGGRLLKLPLRTAQRLDPEQRRLLATPLTAVPRPTDAPPGLRVTFDHPLLHADDGWELAARLVWPSDRDRPPLAGTLDFKTATFAAPTADQFTAVLAVVLLTPALRLSADAPLSDDP